MREIIFKLMGEYGGLAVFLLILFENLFPPVPSEVILTFGGVMTRCTDMTVPEVILASTAGSVAGALILYGAGRILGSRAGELLRDAAGLERAKEWFLKKGPAAVFLCRLVPVVRSLISIPAGVSGMKMAPFLFLTTAGSFLWNTALVLLGRAAGASWERVTEAFGIYADIFLMMLGTGIFLVVMVRGKREKS